MVKYHHFSAELRCVCMFFFFFKQKTAYEIVM